MDEGVHKYLFPADNPPASCGSLKPQKKFSTAAHSHNRASPTNCTQAKLVHPRAVEDLSTVSTGLINTTNYKKNAFQTTFSFATSGTPGPPSPMLKWTGLGAKLSASM